jgi:hypothetical protein
MEFAFNRPRGLMTPFRVLDEEKGLACCFCSQEARAGAPDPHEAGAGAAAVAQFVRPLDDATDALTIDRRRPSISPSRESQII